MADDLLQMFQSITTADHDELVDQFAYLLQLDVNTATFFLESSNWNVETAVNNYLATVEPSLYDVAGGDGPGRRHAHNEESEDLDMDDDDQPAPNNSVAGQFDAQFVTDLSMAQSTVMPPDTTVDMQWSFVNSGSAAWPAGTHLIFSQGDRFDGPIQISVASVTPGARIDIPVRLRMPSQMGSYSGSWRLLSPNGPLGDPMWLVLSVGSSKQDAFQPAQPLVTSATVGGASNNDEDMMDL